MEGKNEVLEEEFQPWAPIESKLVKYSIILGIISLIVLGGLINVFLLK